jgi:hypothetical protein
VAVSLEKRVGKCKKMCLKDNLSNFWQAVGDGGSVYSGGGKVAGGAVTGDEERGC